MLRGAGARWNSLKRAILAGEFITIPRDATVYYTVCNVVRAALLASVEKYAKYEFAARTDRTAIAI